MVAATGCSSFPETHFEPFSFPQGAYIGDVKARPYTVLGLVKTRVDYKTLDPAHSDSELCRNYFNKGARQLLELARSKGAQAVIKVQSVVFYADGTTQNYSDPECSDDGMDGQILMQGIAVNWKTGTSGHTPEEFKTGFVPAISSSSALISAAPLPAKTPVVAPSSSPAPEPAPSPSLSAAPPSPSPSQSLEPSPSPSPTPARTRKGPFHSAIPVGFMPSKLTQPSYEKYLSLRLRKNEDGLDGGIRILWKPTRLVLFTMKRQILDQQSMDAKRVWLSPDFLRSTQERTIALSVDQNGEIMTKLLDLRPGKIIPIRATDQAAGEPQAIILFKGPYADWRLSGGFPKDIVQVVGSAQQNEVAYARYHFTPKGWIRVVRAESGSWKAGQAFPSDDKFPPAGVLK